MRKALSCRSLSLLCLASLCLAAAAEPLNNPNSLWTQNLSNADNKNPGYWQDDEPEIAVAGSTVHVMWMTWEYDSSAHNSVVNAVYYRRSKDNGKTFDPVVRVYAQAGIAFGPSTISDSTTFHHMAVDKIGRAHV